MATPEKGSDKLEFVTAKQVSRTEGPIVKWASSLSPAFPAVVIAGSAVPALGAYEDGFQWPWLIPMLCMLVGGGGLMWMHERREDDTQRIADRRNEEALNAKLASEKQTFKEQLSAKDRDATRKRLKLEKELTDQKSDLAKEQQSYADLLDEMTLAVFHLVLAMEAIGDNDRLQEEMRIVRKAILGQVRKRLGPDDTGVRANLFTVESTTPPVLTTGRWGYDGGNGLRSTRRFRPGDATFDLAIMGLENYVPDVSTLSDSERPHRGYMSFATYPVASDDKLFGILTVDAPNVGDITPFDVQLLGFFAGALALSFSSQQYCRSVPMGNLPVPCDTGAEGEEVGPHD